MPVQPITTHTLTNTYPLPALHTPPTKNKLPTTHNTHIINYLPFTGITHMPPINLVWTDCPSDQLQLAHYKPLKHHQPPLRPKTTKGRRLKPDASLSSFRYISRFPIPQNGNFYPKNRRLNSISIPTKNHKMYFSFEITNH